MKFTTDHYQAIRKVLVIKLRAVGDVVLSTVVLPDLRRTFQTARISFLTEPPAVPVVRSHPALDEVMVFDRNSMSSVELIRRVRSQHYDLVIDLFCNPRTALVTRLSGARYRAGYAFRGRRYAYNIPIIPRGDRVHNTQFNLDALSALNIDIQNRNIYFGFTSDDEGYVTEAVGRWNLEGRRLIALNTGGGWYTKRWQLEKFAELGDRISQIQGLAVVLPWGPGQRSEVETVAGLMKEKALIPPATTLGQLGALLKRCVAMVSNDSGPMHIATAVGTPVLGIYGPTNPLLQGPYGADNLVIRQEELDCLGCNLTACPIGHLCMKELTVDAVMDAFLMLLRKNNII